MKKKVYPFWMYKISVKIRKMPLLKIGFDSSNKKSCSFTKCLHSHSLYDIIAKNLLTAAFFMHSQKGNERNANIKERFIQVYPFCMRDSPTWEHIQRCHVFIHVAEHLTNAKFKHCKPTCPGIYIHLERSPAR